MDLEEFFSKTSMELSAQNSKVTTGPIQKERQFCSMSLENWSEEVIRVRGEYSARKNVALLTGESASLSWPTPSVAGCVEGGVAKNVEMTQSGFKATRENGTSYGAKLRDSVLLTAKLWPTPAARDSKGTDCPADRNRHSPCLPAKTNMIGKTQGRLLNPNWVEQLMGLPPRLTDLGSWGME